MRAITQNGEEADVMIDASSALMRAISAFTLPAARYRHTPAPAFTFNSVADAKPIVHDGRHAGRDFDAMLASAKYACQPILRDFFWLCSA